MGRFGIVLAGLFIFVSAAVEAAKKPCKRALAETAVWAGQPAEKIMASLRRYESMDTTQPVSVFVIVSDLGTYKLSEITQKWLLEIGSETYQVILKKTGKNSRKAKASLYQLTGTPIQLFTVLRSLQIQSGLKANGIRSLTSKNPFEAKKS